MTTLGWMPPYIDADVSWGWEWKIQRLDVHVDVQSRLDYNYYTAIWKLVFRFSSRQFRVTYRWWLYLWTRADVTLFVTL